jgi:exonuclease SbcD
MSMKLLHTADWHLNDRLGKRDRTRHLQERVERVAAICEEERVDVIALAGDVFSEEAKAEEIAASLKHLRSTFRDFFRRGGTILAITGNHDQNGRIRSQIEIVRAAMDLAEPPQRKGELFPPGRFYLVDSPFFGRVRGNDGLEVQMVLLPFLNHSRMKQPLDRALTTEELHRSVEQRAAGWIRNISSDEGFNSRLRTVLMAHLTIKGSELSSGRFQLTEQNDVIADPNDLPTGWDYVALGHIHKPQMLQGHCHIRYSGSLDRLDFSECKEEKGVVLVDLGPNGRRGEPRFIHIPPSPFIQFRVTEASVTAEQIRAQVPEPDKSLVQVTVEADAAAETSAGAVERLVFQTLPQQCITKFTCEVPELKNGAGGVAFKAEPTVRETVLKYLRQELNETDTQRAELLALAETFLGDSHPAREC